MKKIVMICGILLFGMTLIACQPKQKVDPRKEILFQESKLSFEFFWETSNHDENSPGYGLSRDRYEGNTVIASIAAVGFHLASLPAGVENGWVTFEEAQNRALRTLQTLLTLERTKGFYYHFVNIHTGKREWKSEVSVIDTGLMVAGALVAGEYFGGAILEKATEIYDGIEWNWYVNPATNLFYMGYKPEEGFGGAWDHVSEQLILYVLAAGSNTYPTTDRLYRSVKARNNTSYKGTYISEKNPELSVTDTFYYTYDGSLFQQQFSHAFVDFAKVQDYEGTNWFRNATLVTKAAYAYTQDYSDRYKTYGTNSWGLSAGDGPGEYHAYGSGPAKSNKHNGTITPYAALASINYMEEEALRAAQYYNSISELNGRYGLKDSFNLGPVDPNYNPVMANKTPWYASDYIGIDKGITLLMIENYRSGLIWKNFMKNKNVQQGLETLGFIHS